MIGISAVPRSKSGVEMMRPGEGRRVAAIEVGTGRHVAVVVVVIGNGAMSSLADMGAAKMMWKVSSERSSPPSGARRARRLIPSSTPSPAAAVVVG